MTDIRCLPLETPTILKFSGPDAIRFLNGQMTQEVNGLENHAKPSCITNAKGRLEHFVSICAGEEKESIWVTSLNDSAEVLRERLERYLIADEVQVDDLTGQWQRIHAEAPLRDPGFSRSTMGIFGEGVDHWWPTDQAPSLAAIERSEQEDLRIAQGIPAWGSELEAGMLPPEAGLDQSAVSYHKGCYIGQEVLSRMKTAGKVNRRLGVLEVSSEVSPGDPVMLGDRAIGQLTSVAPNGQHALAYIKKTGFDEVSYQVGTHPAALSRWT